MTKWKQRENVKGVARGDEPTYYKIIIEAFHGFIVSFSTFLSSKNSHNLALSLLLVLPNILWLQ